MLTFSTTPFHACVNIIKCVVGAGSFFLPYGLLKGGLWASAVGLVLLGCLCDYINVRIIQCKRKVFPEGNPSYPDLVAATLGTHLVPNLERYRLDFVCLKFLF